MKEEILAKHFEREMHGYSFENCLGTNGNIAHILKAALDAMEEYATQKKSESIPSVTNEEDELLWEGVYEIFYRYNYDFKDAVSVLKKSFTISRKPSSSSLHS